MEELDSGECVLSIIIVNYNSCDLLKNCIQSIYNSYNKTSLEIIVVDNASIDESRKIITTLYPKVIWIQNADNVGFAAANNQGIKISKGKYCMLLNNDTLVLEDALDKLVLFLEDNEEVGAVGPRILNKDGSLQLSCRRGLPTLLNSIGYFTKLYKVFPKNKKLGSYTMSYLSDTVSHEVEALSGAAMVINKDILLNIDGLDEKYFMHFEDVDLCLRIGKLGYKLYYICNSKIIHLKGQSSKLRSKKVIEDYHNSLNYYYRKNYAKDKSIILNYLVLFFVFLRKILCILVYNIKSIKRIVGGNK